MGRCLGQDVGQARCKACPGASSMAWVRLQGLGRGLGQYVGQCLDKSLGQVLRLCRDDGGQEPHSVMLCRDHRKTN